MGKAFVTGANGHLGASLVRDLIEHGHEVVAFVRPGADLRGLAGLDPAGCVVEKGEVVDEASVARAMKGCELVFHAAAPYVVWAKDPQAIIGPTLRGTEAVLAAASKHGVRRVVVTSSCNAVGFTSDPSRPLDETSWNEATKSPYIRAKNEQERRARALAKELGIGVVTVLPTAVLGPFDYKRTPTTAPFVDALAGKGPVPFGMNLVDVRDVARAHVLAAERGEDGERYLAGGDNVDLPTLAGIVEKLTGKRPAEGLPPLWILRTVAFFAELGSSVTGKAPMITNALLDDAGGRSPLFDCTKARERLGLAPRPAEDVMREALRWALFMGWLPDKLAERLRDAHPPDPAWARHASVVSSSNAA
jgi:dihydroflavonol-4-reductase